MLTMCAEFYIYEREERIRYEWYGTQYHSYRDLHIERKVLDLNHGIARQHCSCSKICFVTLKYLSFRGKRKGSYQLLGKWPWRLTSHHSENKRLRC